MKILLLGDYSNVHATLARGLRALGHSVVVASDGDDWKGYARDVDLRRRGTGLRATAGYLARLARAVPAMRGFDVVQLINPVFLELRAERLPAVYRYLRRHNGRMVLGAFGMDHYWVRAGRSCATFRYGDFNFGPRLRTGPDEERWVGEWGAGPKGRLNRLIAHDCDGIAAGLYEYAASYRLHFPCKTRFLPLPIDPDACARRAPHAVGSRVRFFIGIQRHRSAYKGTDVMLRALERVERRWPERVEVVRAENVPFATYQHLMDTSDVVLDQLYSYTPGMNALLAMAKGLVVVGGGEEENYAILGERELRPIVNVRPDEADVEARLEHLALHPDEVRRLGRDSRVYVERHHHYVKVARQYLDFWQSLPAAGEGRARP